MTSFKTGITGTRKSDRRPVVGGSRGAARKGRGGKAKLQRDAFYATRVEEASSEARTGEHLEEKEPQKQSEDEQSIEPSGVSSDSEGDDLLVAPTKAYRSLLQSLSTNGQRSEPPRKRRKLESIETTVANEVSDDDIGEREEPDSAEESEGHRQGDLDELDNSKDPYTKHFSTWDEGVLGRAIQGLGTAKITRPKSMEWESWSTSYEGPSDSMQSQNTTNRCASTIMNELHLKQKLKDPVHSLSAHLDPVEASVAAAVFHYQDVLFPHRTLRRADVLRRLLCSHALNHVLKTRDKIIKNNARLSRHDASEDLDLRDQGFTRPKVLFLLPTRNSCVKYVEEIISFCEPEQQENKKRFYDTYANGEDNFSPEKPADFRELFAGNDDDLFRLGLKFTRKTVKYFSQFYNSDIIFASALGLRMALGGEDPKKQDNDFLSSIEVIIVDQADAIAMQNWEHIEHIFERLNLQPKETHGCDFSRVRHWYLDGQAKYLRQTILLSAFNFPALNRMYTKSLHNVAGKVKYSQNLEGVIVELGLSLKQTFSRLEYKTPVSEPDDRFHYFSAAVVPSLVKTDVESRKGTLIFIPSYADFVRVRNYFASSSDTEHISFGSICEYTSVPDVARARSHFLSGRHSVLLYTERAHHFRRYHLKGVRQVVLYALPENPTFYQEIVGDFLQSSMSAAKITAREARVRVLFSKLDILKLERVVGSSRHLPMVFDKVGDTFVFE